jgi:hypothetical protein
MNLLNYGKFTSHSGKRLHYKIDCDALSDEDLKTIAKIIGSRLQFKEVLGIPSGGMRLAKELKKYKVDDADMVIIVDDVLTTGESMEFARKHSLKFSAKYCSNAENIIGVVIFNRMQEPLPKWIYPVFNVSTWFEQMCSYYHCPKCGYPQYCGCKSCIDELPEGMKPYKWDEMGELISCANCGYTEHVDIWGEIEEKELKFNA